MSFFGFLFQGTSVNKGKATLISSAINKKEFRSMQNPLTVIKWPRFGMNLAKKLRLCL